MNEWISVNQKPENDCTVLIASNYGVRSGFFSKSWNGKFQDHVTGSDEGMFDMDDVKFVPTHWMPMPEPPVEGL